MDDIAAEIDDALNGGEHTASVAMRLQSQDAEYWHRFTVRAIFIVRDWCRANNIPSSATDDFVSDVMLRVVQGVAKFHPERGSIRHWLRSLCRTVEVDLRLRGTKAVVPTADYGEITAVADPSLEDFANHVADEEQRERFRQAIAKVLDFADLTTAEVFREHMLQGIDAKIVARHWALSVEEVERCSAKILDRVRDECRGLIDIEEVLARRRLSPILFHDLSCGAPPRQVFWELRQTPGLSPNLEWVTITDENRSVSDRAAALTALVARRDEEVAGFVLTQLEDPYTTDEWLPSLLNAAEFAVWPELQKLRLWRAVYLVASRLRTADTVPATRSFATAMRCLGLRLPVEESSVLAGLLEERPDVNAKFELSRRQAILQAIQTMFSAGPPTPASGVTQLQHAVEALLVARLNAEGFTAGPAASLTANALTTLACLAAPSFAERAIQFAQVAPKWLKPMAAQYLADVQRRWQERGVASERLAPLVDAQRELAME